MQLHHRIGIFCLMTVLAGCAKLTTSPTGQAEKETEKPKTWAEREATLNRIQAWHLNGKIAVRAPKDSGSASMSWSENHSSYNIALMGPLGSNSLKLHGRPNSVTLETSKGERFTAKSPEELLARQWGFNVPVSNLRYWIRGLPVPGVPASKQLDSRNRLVSLSQSGWHVQFPAYTKSSGVELPSKVFLTSSSLDVKIIVYGWQI